MQKREQERFPAEERVELNLDGEVLRCRLRNIAPAGCMLACDCEEKLVGRDVSVTLLEGIVPEGRIVWQTEGYVGVRFYRDLGKVTVDYFRVANLMVLGDCEPVDVFGRPLPPLSRNVG